MLVPGFLYDAALAVAFPQQFAFWASAVAKSRLNSFTLQYFIFSTGAKMNLKGSYATSSIQ